MRIGIRRGCRQEFQHRGSWALAVPMQSDRVRRGMLWIPGETEWLAKPLGQRVVRDLGRPLGPALAALFGADIARRTWTSSNGSPRC